MLNCWYHHILLSFVSKIPDLCLFHNRFGEDCCCSEIYFKLTWTLRQIAFELLHFLQLCATAIPLLKSRFIMELSAPARSISSLCIGMNHRNVNLDSEFTLHSWRKIQWPSWCQGFLPELEQDTRVFCLLMQKIMKQSSFWCKSLLQVKALWWLEASRVKTLLWDPVQLFPAGQNSTGTDMRRRSIMAWDLETFKLFHSFDLS